MYRCFTQCD